MNKIKKIYILVLIKSDWVIKDIANIHDRFGFGDIRMLFSQEPASMSGEEASAGVIRVSIGLSVPVVHTMKSAPSDQASLLRGTKR